MRKEDWIPISKLPEEMMYRGETTGISHHVLVTDGGSQWVAFYSFNAEETRKWILAHGEDLDDEMSKRKVTHWMPLPEKP